MTLTFLGRDYEVHSVTFLSRDTIVVMYWHKEITRTGEIKMVTMTRAEYVKQVSNVLL